jgi:hypothetical protein
MSEPTTPKELAHLIEDAIVRSHSLSSPPTLNRSRASLLQTHPNFSQLLEEIDRDLYRSKELWKVTLSSPTTASTRQPRTHPLARSSHLGSPQAVAESLAAKPSPKQHGQLPSPSAATNQIPRKAYTHCM